MKFPLLKSKSWWSNCRRLQDIGHSFPYKEFQFALHMAYRGDRDGMREGDRGNCGSSVKDRGENMFFIVGFKLSTKGVK